MKSDTRTVLNATLTSVGSYSSGPLFGGDLRELAIDFIVSATGGTGDYGFTVSRIATDGSLRQLGQWFSASLPTPISLGPAFGDQIQVDMVNSSGWSVTGTVSILGK